MGSSCTADHSTPAQGTIEKAVAQTEQQVVDATIDNTAVDMGYGQATDNAAADLNAVAGAAQEFESGAKQVSGQVGATQQIVSGQLGSQVAPPITDNTSEVWSYERYNNFVNDPQSNLVKPANWTPQPHQQGMAMDQGAVVVDGMSGQLPVASYDVPQPLGYDGVTPLPISYPEGHAVDSTFAQGVSGAMMSQGEMMAQGGVVHGTDEVYHMSPEMQMHGAQVVDNVGYVQPTY